MSPQGTSPGHILFRCIVPQLAHRARKADYLCRASSLSQQPLKRPRRSTLDGHECIRHNRRESSRRQHRPSPVIPAVHSTKQADAVLASGRTCLPIVACAVSTDGFETKERGYSILYFSEVSQQRYLWKCQLPTCIISDNKVL